MRRELPESKLVTQATPDFDFDASNREKGNFASRRTDDSLRRGREWLASRSSPSALGVCSDRRRQRSLV